MTDSFEDKKIPAKTLIAFFGMVLGMFMAILDIQIVASSLSVIGAGLAASGDELSWIQTSYLIAEVIIIPVTGFTARLLSTRISYFIAALGFTIMSILCSLAWSIESMIIFRAFQGFFGGAMIPTAFGVIFIIFPKSMHTKVSVIVGLVVTIAPTVGPTLGGYITEILSWQFMFLINVIPGVFVCFVVLFLDIDKPNYKLLKNFDVLGLALMSFSLGGLQYVLEEGHKKGWMDDAHILFLSIFVFFAFVLLLIREIVFVNPIIQLSAFKNKNFTFGCIYSFILGIGLYGTVYLLPVFLFAIPGYNSLQIGLTMFTTGIFQLLSAPIAGSMSEAGVDKRIILFIGFLLFALGCYLNSFLTVESAYWELFVPQMVRGMSLMFCFLPINDLALGTMSKSEVQDASGLYNLTRNLGGAIGLAIINSSIQSKSDIFVQSIKDNISYTSVTTKEYFLVFSNLIQGKGYDSEKIAYYSLNNLIEKEAFIIAINNIFVIIGLIFCIGMLLIPFSSMPKNDIKR